MQAIRGFYNNGILQLEKNAPAKKASVIVLFTDEEKKSKMPINEALKILHKYAGCIENDIDFEKERDEYLNEKYGNS